MDTISHWVIQHGYVGIFVLLMLGIAGLPIPDETLLTFAGYLVFKRDLHLVPTVTSAFLGSVCGISLSYGLGRTFGYYLIKKYGYLLHVTEEKVTRVHNWFERVGRWTLTFGYFIPGVRHLTAYVAGTSKVEWPVFALFAYSGGFIWAATFISIGYFLGERWEQALEKIHHHLVIGSAIIIALLLIYFLAHQRSMNKSRTGDETREPES